MFYLELIASYYCIDNCTFVIKYFKPKIQRVRRKSVIIPMSRDMNVYFGYHVIEVTWTQKLEARRKILFTENNH